jgi:hypothetical protein
LPFGKSELFLIFRNFSLDNEFRKSELICPSGQFVAPAPAAGVNQGNPGGRWRLSGIIFRETVMKTSAAIFAVAVLALASAAPANAKGCLKGAVVGGVAGHYAGHHGVAGAIAGCAYGRHRANEQQRQQQTRVPAGQEKL